MKNKCAKLSGYLQTTAFWILTVFALVIGAFLAYSAMRYSYYSGIAGEPIRLIADSTKSNLLFVVLAFLFAFILDYQLKKKPLNRVAGYVFLGICSLIFFIVGCIWTAQNPYYPVGDQISTTAAAHYNLSGNFSMLYSGGYLGIHSHQKGLTFLYEIFFTLFGDFCYNVVEKFHVASGVVTMIFGYLFLEDISDRCSYRIMYCLLLLFCTPYMILMPYAYGDIFSISACVVMFWAINRYNTTLQKKYVVLSCFMSVLAIFTRTHSWVVLIAIAIGMLMLALEKKTIRPIIACACIILSAALSLELLSISYEIRSGIENTHGTPSSLYLAMGLQDNLDGPGIYNRFHQTVFENVDFDRDAAEAIGWQEVNDLVRGFISSPAYAKRFFRQKLEMQWLEPLYETLITTGTFDEELPVPQWIWEIYHGKYHDPLFRFANHYQSVVYIAFVAFVLCMPRKKQSFAFYIPLISMVGGFLFSIIWENQCRYVLPYYLFILPYIPIGLCSINDMIVAAIRKLQSTRSNTRDTSRKDDESTAA